MLNRVVTGIEVVLLAACLALTLAIRQERTGAGDAVPWWLSTKWRLTGPLTERGRLLWWLRVLCIGLPFSVMLLLNYDK
jgi:hypothetical protein